MLYTHHNARGASVFDVEHALELKNVQSVDMDSGVVTIVPQPVRADAHGEVVTEQRRFARIHPIGLSGLGPRLFHCYGPT